MIRINLLPFRSARRKENVRRQISIFLLSLFLLAVLLVWYHVHLGGKIKRIDKQIAATKKELAEKQQQVAEADRILKDLENLKRKTEVIGNLALNRKEAVRMLDTLPGLVIEKKMWFTSLEESQNTVNIRGIALDNKTVADFMTRLEESALFSEVRLQSTKRTKIGDYDNLKSFVISTNKVPLGKVDQPKDEAKPS